MQIDANLAKGIVERIGAENVIVERHGFAFRYGARKLRTIHQQTT
ncbi:MAG: hypothetical protein WA758_11005 [Candidatus Acidiferrales bacterium]